VPLIVPAGYDGATLYFQFAALNLAAGPTNIHMSNALAVTLGQR
jgi:hypothetical protein